MAAETGLRRPWGQPSPCSPPRLARVADESDAAGASGDTRLAIEILTVWIPGLWEPQQSEARKQAREHLRLIVREEGLDTILAGQLTLAFLLLKKLAEQHGATNDTLLAEIGTILQEVSRDLPS